MDQAWFLYLNGWPVSAPVLGTFAVLVSKYGIVLYPLLVLGLWWRGSGEPERRRGVLLLSVLAVVLALGVNTVLNGILPRPRPFLVLPAHVLVTPPHDSSFPSDHAAVTSAIAVTLLCGVGGGWGVLGLLGALVIGASRVIVGVQVLFQPAEKCAVGPTHHLPAGPALPRHAPDNEHIFSNLRAAAAWKLGEYL